MRLSDEGARDILKGPQTGIAFHIIGHQLLFSPLHVGLWALTICCCTPSSCASDDVLRWYLMENDDVIKWALKRHCFTDYWTTDYWTTGFFLHLT
jgi:hypothetical protein